MCQDTNTEPDKHLPSEFIDYSKSYFDRLAADFDHLDNKALGIMAVIGILVGFQALGLDNIVFLITAWLKPGHSPWLCLMIFPLVIHACALLLAIIFALLAFQIRDVKYPTDISNLITEFRRAKNCKSLEYSLNTDIVETYKQSIASLHKTNDHKAALLKRSVRWVFVAVLSSLVILIFLLILKSIP